MAYFITSSFILFAILFVHISIFDVTALRNMQIKVPEAVRVGDSVTLACDYDLESVALYTIKWYRNDEEFYRYVPKESPPSKVFTMPHVFVDPQRSNSQEVTLTNVDRDTAGQFKCEVSADGPLFHTDIRHAQLLVAEIPDEEPVLRTDVQKVAPGGKIKANCTTPGSYPNMNVTWFINDNELPSSTNDDIQIQNAHLRYDALPKLEIVRSTITIRATTDLFKNSKIKLRCLATMFTLYTFSKEAEVQEDAPQLALIREQTTPANEGTSIAIKNYSNILMVILLFYVHLHAWLRRRIDN